MTVRVRFAPSPTGYLHVGAARTAVYNWLFARHGGGQFVLRSDDTDAERNEGRFAADIAEALDWLGIEPDEGGNRGGPHAPYRQSERLDRYRFVVDGLLAAGRAYHDFATPEQLDEFRGEAAADGRSPVYDGRFRIDEAGTARRLADGEAAPVRFAVPRPGSTRFVDAVRGEMEFDHANVDDFVILRSDGSPTYHLASTVDDVDFEITHVVRGEDLLSSTPKHILLTEAMGAAEATYAHLSLLTGPDGKKLSKRHGDTAIRTFCDAGILPETMFNYLAILGWAPGDDEEVVARDLMVERFDLGSVSRNPAVLDTTKLEWMNGVYIRAMAQGDFAERVASLVESDLGRRLQAEETKVLRELAPLVQERARTLLEVAPQVGFLFVDEPSYDEGSWSKVMMKVEAGDALRGAAAALSDVNPWHATQIEAALRGMLEETGLSARKGLQPIRVAVTGSAVSPPLFESLQALGPERSLHRITTALSLIADR